MPWKLIIGDTTINTLNHIESVMPKSLINLDIDLLRTFVVIASERNFTRAAERLMRQQSTVSLQIKRLEDALGQLGGRLLQEAPPRSLTFSRLSRSGGTAKYDQPPAAKVSPDSAVARRAGRPASSAAAADDLARGIAHGIGADPGARL